MIPNLALFAGVISLLAAVAKYSMDRHRGRAGSSKLRVSIGDQSIDVSNLSAEQVTALVTALKEQTNTRKAA